MAKHIIELYGLPGVGKTTYSKELSAQGYVSVPDNPKRSGYILLLFRYPLTVLLWVSLIIVNAWHAKSVQILRYDLAVFFVSLQKINTARSLPAERVVLEEGMINRILSLSYTLHSPARIRRLLRVTPVGHTLLHVNHRAVERTRYNSQHPRLQLGESSFTAWQTRLKKNLATVISVLQSENRYDDTKDQATV